MSLRGGTTKQPRSSTEPISIPRDCHAIARNDKFLLLLFFCLFSFNENSFAQQVNWVGNYKYEEKPVKSGNGYTSMFITWNLNVKLNSNSYTGLLEVNGYQTYYQYLTDIHFVENGIQVVFVKQSDGIKYEFGQPKPGDILFTLVNKGGKLDTSWGTLSPVLANNPLKTCSCFLKK